jgi:hypothetical protein
MLIHPKAPITWVADGVIHVLCYKPGLVKKPRKTAVPGTLGLRDGRLFLPSPSPQDEVTPAKCAGREESAGVRQASAPPPPLTSTTTANLA